MFFLKAFKGKSLSGYLLVVALFLCTVGSSQLFGSPEDKRGNISSSGVLPLKASEPSLVVPVPKRREYGLSFPIKFKNQGSHGFLRKEGLSAAQRILNESKTPASDTFYINPQTTDLLKEWREKMRVVNELDSEANKYLNKENASCTYSPVPGSDPIYNKEDSKENTAE